MISVSDPRAKFPVLHSLSNTAEAEADTQADTLAVQTADPMVLSCSRPGPLYKVRLPPATTALAPFSFPLSI